MRKLNGKKVGSSTLAVIAWRNIWRNRRRTVLCITAVAIAVFFIIFMNAWMDGMFDGIEDVVRTFDTGHVSAVSRGYDADREYLPVQFPVAQGRSGAEIIAEAEKLDHVTAALPRITVFATLFDSKVKHALLWGIDIEKERKINRFNLTRRDDGMLEGRYPDPGKNECAIGTAMARKAGLGIGDRIPLKMVSAHFSDKYWSPVVTGIFEFDYRKFDEETIVVPIDRLQSILGLDEGIQQLVIYADDKKHSGVIRNQIRDILGDDDVVREWNENYWVSLFRSMGSLYIVIFAVFQIVASFLIINTMLMIIHERIKEIGMMGALGMTRGEIVAVFFLEALILSALGAAAGTFVGGAASWAGSLFPIDMNVFTGGGMKEMPVSGTLYISFSVMNLLEGFLFGVVVTAVCTLVPSMKSAFIKPVEALRR